MSALGCAEVRELAPELALGIVSGPQRADALQHASECGPCRVLVGELAEAGDALPLLAAEAEPPPGFEQRALSALKAPRRRTRRRIAAALGVAAAAAAVISIVGVRIVESTQEDTTQSAHAAGQVRSAEMTGANGLYAGNMFVTDGRPATVVVNVSYGVPAGTYGIEFRAGSTTKRIGDMRIRDDGQGSWGAVTRLPATDGGSVVLVDDKGAVVCEGRVPRVS
jgi:hypothetical protein